MEEWCGWYKKSQRASECRLTVGKMFSLHGRVELRELKPSQIQRQSNPDHYVYTENVSKTRNGTFKQLHVPNKVVPLFKCPQAGERCPVHILDTYFSKLPYSMLFIGQRKIIILGSVRHIYIRSKLFQLTVRY